ncbi:MAG: formate--tetrahydrofolate ligase [Thermoplasmataceae archaeon]
MKKIDEIASGLGLSEEEYETYGGQIAKVSLSAYERRKNKQAGKLILVTGTNPTSAGEGKTTTVIGLGQAFSKLGKKVAIALREPSLGPCFGIKGGATGGGKATVEPSDRINLFFTSDFPAVTAAHNLLSAMINNHIYHGNALGIEHKMITFPRTIDMNDRSLRSIITGVGPSETGAMANDKFVITPASEIMAILGLSKDYNDLKKRLSGILVGFTRDNKPVFARDLKAEGAMAALLRDALKPNLVQTNDGVPAFIHTGPFGNIAHGTSSIVADRIALRLADYVITEAGFGSELGGEKFFDLVTRIVDLDVHAVVIVTTLRALKHQGKSKEPGSEDLVALEAGIPNLLRHVEIMRSFGAEPVVAVNAYSSDTEKEKNFLTSFLDSHNVPWAFSSVYTQGGDGGLELARKVLDHIKEGPLAIKRKYSLDDPVKDKIRKIAEEVYGASDVRYSPQAVKDLRRIKSVGAENLPICMAKTQYSISDNPTLLGSPRDFVMTVHSIGISSGAGFLVPYLGEIMTMPGLPAKPAAENVDLTEDGEITGLF